MDDPEFASIPPAIQNMDLVALEMLVTPGGGTFTLQAKAELERRDRKYAREQERSRRDFESALADKQLSAATDVAKATRWAMWAAFAAAISAILQAVVAIASYYYR